MEMQNKNRRDLYLQKGNKCWKWMAGATAATAAGVAASQAGTITINLTGNYISGSGGNHLNPDLTGDGQPDITITGAFYRFRSSPSISTFATKATASVHLNGVFARAYHSGHYPLASEQLGSKHGFEAGGSGTAFLTGSIPITFRDLHINNGKLTKGFLDVIVSGAGPTGLARIQLDSVTYRIREQGSSLALLAMGAAGVLAVRQWRTARGLA